MKAAVLKKLNGPPEFDDFDDPVAGEGQVVVENSRWSLSAEYAAVALDGAEEGVSAIAKETSSLEVGAVAGSRELIEELWVSGGEGDAESPEGGIELGQNEQFGSFVNLLGQETVAIGHGSAGEGVGSASSLGSDNPALRARSVATCWR